MTKSIGNFNYLHGAASHPRVFKSKSQVVPRRKFLSATMKWGFIQMIGGGYLCLLWFMDTDCHHFTALFSPFFLFTPFLLLVKYLYVLCVCVCVCVCVFVCVCVCVCVLTSNHLMFKRNVSFELSCNPSPRKHDNTRNYFLLSYITYLTMINNWTLDILGLVDGSWSCWSSWSKCSVTCGGGHYMRTRTCSNPPPAYGGDICLGLHTEEALCNTQTCPGIYTQTHTHTKSTHTSQC